jgi:hypothetical protein
MGNGEWTSIPHVIMRLGGTTLDEKYRDYMSLAIMFLVLILMLILLFLNKTSMVEKGTGAIGEVVRSLSLEALRA